MSPKNSVAAERRMDLASLFCLIGRHGPAVAVAVVALVSVLAGFIIYRSVSGKRRKAAAADRDGRDGPGPGDASVIRASLEGSRSSAESTDMSDEGSSEVKEDVDLIQSDLKIRHRRAAAAEKEPPPYSPSKSDIQVPANKHTTPDDTTEVTAVVWGSHKEAEAHAEDASQGLQSDTCAVAEDAAECRRGATDDTAEDVIEEFHDNDGHLKEPELSDDEEHEEEEEGGSGSKLKAFLAPCHAGTALHQ